MGKANMTAARSWNAWNALHDDGLELVDPLHQD